MKQIGYNTDMAKKNFVGGLVLFIPLYILIFYFNHGTSYAVKYGVISGILISAALAALLYFLDPLVMIKLNFRESKKAIQLYDPTIVDQLEKQNEAISTVGNPMYADITFERTDEDSLTITGSKYRIKKFLKLMEGENGNTVVDL